ncbi:MAG: hypothetical protein KGK00_17810, partial [Paracoccaceae bacterium]|nr:hypothetical protein [Paracoccaceae bacterium]
MTGPARSGSLLPLVTLDHPAIEIDLVYATDRNFTGQRLYADNRARLVPEAARALKCVAERLADQGLRLVVLD